MGNSGASEIERLLQEKWKKKMDETCRRLRSEFGLPPVQEPQEDIATKGGTVVDIDAVAGKAESTSDA